MQPVPAPLAPPVILSPQAIPSAPSAEATLFVSTDVTTISLAHWKRLEHGALLAKTTVGLEQERLPTETVAY